MKLQILALSAAVACSGLLTACVDEPVGPPGVYADVDYVAYYDGYYGPFDGGYWGPGGYFYYAGRDHRYHRDHGGHFRHQDGGAGYRPIQGHAPPATHAGRHH